MSPESQNTNKGAEVGQVVSIVPSLVGKWIVKKTQDKSGENKEDRINFYTRALLRKKT